MKQHLLLPILISLAQLPATSWSIEDKELTCKNLEVGQYVCDDARDPETQEIKNCHKNRTASVRCETVAGLQCDGSQLGPNGTEFQKEVPCVYTNGKSHRTAVLLSIFLGMLGADRFYLGYYAIGLLKFCTMGLLFVGQFVDFILIATQVVGPADGSDYVMGYRTPRFSRMWVNNETYFHSSDL
ncbi:TM2 domain-containing protein 1-like [Apostichopus japonicus]|uniref:TM2 domain-containing protein 1-like n=1 Tax=Stichopus japonicus TaxID=307972 RepID=UPI003AB7478B